MATAKARAASKPDVLIIGAGLSGLNAALNLQRAGLVPQVIEGRSRAGGRLMTHFDLPGTPEAGGMGQRPHYARFLDTAAELGLKTVNTIASPFRDNYLLSLNGEIIDAKAWRSHKKNKQPDPYRELLPWAFLSRLVRDKNPLIESLDWIEEKHAHLDVSMHAYMRSLGVDEEAIYLAFLNASHGYSAHHISALQMFHADTWGKTIEREKSPAASFRLLGGNQKLPLAMENALTKDVHYNKDVIKIEVEKTQCVVRCADGSSYAAPFVISSIPFSVLRRISIDPPLAGVQAEAVNCLGYDLITKVSLVPVKPYWKDDGLSPNMHTDNRFGRLRAEAADESGEIGTLTMTLYGPNAQRADEYGPQYVENVLLPEISNLRPAAKGQLKIAKIYSWSTDPYSAGAESCLEAGQVTKYVTRMGLPHGRLLFCGEHLSSIFRGSMEGAMETGENAAVQLLEMAGK